MKSEKERLTATRRENLKEWFSDKTLPQKDKSYISQLISGKTPSFGEAAARRLESENGMPKYYLDTPKSGELKKIKIESNVGELGSFDLWDRHTPMNDDEVAVPFYKDIRLAAGNGFADDIADYNGFKLRFSKATLRRAGVQYENAVCVTASGNSMEPVLPDGTTVGVDLGDKAIKDGSMYAINHGGLLRVKILHLLPNNQIRIKSYNNEEHKDETAKLEDIGIIGKVFWWSVLL
ncbi:helix-turn-helix transcriptional regulator [Pasteurellaceae bacterium USgator11]|nr:helix-turn-helix transcriptional regulator [Pasteurellaceae bacterium USgator41]TNG96448.1 helix-turn-helix transcriptional regulator [Pasteurellaceae bacterium UScroc12]TNH00470.1 helix-turn-helix transcriptional regulator [Pasteurellaceae bacterium UScroc31]TNH01699.1 helix-turn-helix transcriptional regulator [Pasteurellaceae bacterium USgator11]